MTSEVGLGIIGCGGMGMSVLTKVLAADRRLRVVGLFDPDARSIANAQKTLKSAPPVFDDYHKLVADPAVQWVMIASWNCFHSEQAVAALAAGKHVFCQKPLAISVEQCVAMQAAWRKAGRLFNMGFNLRYSPHYRKLKQIIDSGALGRIVSMEFNETLDFNHGGYIMGNWRRLRKNAGTHLLEKCCHDVDLTNWMIGSVATRVASFGGLNFFRPENVGQIARVGKDKGGREAFSSWGGIDPLNPFTSDKDIIDNQVAILEFANGVRASFHTNCQSAIPERRMYINGTEGALRADVLAGTIELKRIGFDTTLENVSTDGSGGHGGGDEVLAVELADTMINGTPPMVSLPEGVKSAVTCLAIDDALDTGKVVDVRPYWAKVGVAVA
jgi:predicted dehydrogenase